MTVMYEFMSFDVGVFVIEFVLELYLLWPHLCGKQILGTLALPARLFLASTVLGLFHAPLELYSDPRLGGTCPWFWISLDIAMIEMGCLFGAVASIALTCRRMVNSALRKVTLDVYNSTTVAVENNVVAGEKKKPGRALLFRVAAILNNFTDKQIWLIHAVYLGPIFAYWGFNNYMKACHGSKLWNLMELALGVVGNQPTLIALFSTMYSAYVLEKVPTVCPDFLPWLRLFKRGSALFLVNFVLILTPAVILQLLIYTGVSWVQPLHKWVDCVFCFVLWNVIAAFRLHFVYVIARRGSSLLSRMTHWEELFDAATAALLLNIDENNDVIDVVQGGMERLYGLRLSDITYQDFAETESEETKANLRKMSRQDSNVKPTKTKTVIFKCTDDQIDVFLSHSWHDNTEAKWIVMQQYNERFIAEHGREPIWWIDKFCIEQRTVALQLPFLPVYICACKEMLVLCGDTYLQRLWCSWELWMKVGSQQKGNAATCDSLVFETLPGCNITNVLDQVQNYDARNCKCYYEIDKTKMMAIIEQATGGIDGFNTQIRAYFEVLTSASERQKRLQNATLLVHVASGATNVTPAATRRSSHQHHSSTVHKIVPAIA
jgi:hypothetical protein